MSKIKRIGLTGNIGSGKSTVAKQLVAKGAALIDSDALARAATHDPEVLGQIVEQLGSDLVQAGSLDRQKTADLVFANPDALKTLNGIVHPWVRAQSQKLAEAFSQQTPAPKLILHDIPLLYENGLDKTLDAVIVVNAPLDLRVARVKERSALSEADIRSRDAHQLALDEKVKRADYVIHNDGSLAYLEKQIDKLWNTLTT